MCILTVMHFTITKQTLGDVTGSHIGDSCSTVFIWDSAFSFITDLALLLCAFAFGCRKASHWAADLCEAAFQVCDDFCKSTNKMVDFSSSFIDVPGWFSGLYWSLRPFIREGTSATHCYSVWWSSRTFITIYYNYKMRHRQTQCKRACRKAAVKVLIELH